MQIFSFFKQNCSKVLGTLKVVYISFVLRNFQHLFQGKLTSEKYSKFVAVEDSFVFIFFPLWRKFCYLRNSKWVFFF